MSKQDGENVVTFKGTVDEFRDLVSKYDGLIVASFWAQWCAPCRRLTGILPQMASENPKVKFVKIDVDENPELAEYYEITGVPNVRLFKGMENGKPNQVCEIQGLDNTSLKDSISTHSK